MMKSFTSRDAEGTSVISLHVFRPAREVQTSLRVKNLSPSFGEVVFCLGVADKYYLEFGAC
jgi:hypothetical protein